MPIDPAGLRAATIALSKDAIQRMSSGEFLEDRFERAKSCVLDGHIGFGPVDDAFEIACAIIEALRKALANLGQDALAMESLDGFLSAIYSEVKAQLEALPEGADPQQVADTITVAICEHPSHLDSIASALAGGQPVHGLQAEQSLVQSTLKVITTNEHGHRFLGTGFAVGEPLRIVTAHHVVADARHIEVSFRGAPSRQDAPAAYEAKIVARFEDEDLAILAVEGQQDRDPDGNEAVWDKAGLERCTPAFAGPEDLAGHPVLGLGYHAQTDTGGASFESVCPVRADVAFHSPMREVCFAGDDTGQECLILVVRQGQETLVRGMSGGPLLDLETGEIIGFMTGARGVQSPVRIRQSNGTVEELPVVEYGYGVLFSHVLQRHPDARQYFCE